VEKHPGELQHQRTAPVIILAVMTPPPQARHESTAETAPAVTLRPSGLWGLAWPVRRRWCAL
jgi:hypothetical protein